MEGIREGSLDVCRCREVIEEDKAGTERGKGEVPDSGEIGVVERPGIECFACCGERFEPDPETRLGDSRKGKKLDCQVVRIISLLAPLICSSQLRRGRTCVTSNADDDDPVLSSPG